MTSNEREYLRDLAKKQLEIAKSPEMDKLKKEWTLHNDCKGERPMVTVELFTFSDNVIKPMLKCTDEKARQLEWRLLSNMINHTVFKDDSVVDDFISVHLSSGIKPFNIDVRTENTGGLGHHFVSVITDLEEDFGKLQKSEMSFTEKFVKDEFVDDTIGDILPQKVNNDALYVVPTQNIVHIMSMEDMYFAMYDYPDLFKKMMDMLTNDYLEFFDKLEEKQLIRPTVGSNHLGQGTYCFTEDLPSYKDTPFKTSDVWGFMDSQETAGISAEMFEEFIFPYYKRISDRYGLLSYGCCEATDPIWDSCLSKLDNLRKVSISPWCNEEFMGERLAGKKIIYHRKPSPNFLGVKPEFDEEGFRAHIDKTLAAAKGCFIEFTQRDVYTVHGNTDKVRRYVEIVREECEKHYRR